MLTANGVKIFHEKNGRYDFIADVLPEIDYIFEASPNGVGLQNKRRLRAIDKFKRILCCKEVKRDTGFHLCQVLIPSKSKINGL